MDGTEFKAVLREETGTNKAKKIRMEAGKIPAIVYGNGLNPTNLTININELVKLFHRSPKSKNTLLNLTFDGNGKTEIHEVLAHKFEFHPVSRDIIHVDFIKIDPTKKLNIKTPVKLEGNAPGIKMGGILIQNTDVLKITCKPTDIPENIKVDVSTLEIGDNVRVKDLAEDKKIIINNPIHQILAQVQSSRVAKAAGMEDEEGAAAAPGAAPEAGAAPAVAPEGNNVNNNNKK
ncbi:50S ribosomal protein L25 [Candidatus Margulisiibacteriota bacterium]